MLWEGQQKKLQSTKCSDSSVDQVAMPSFKSCQTSEQVSLVVFYWGLQSDFLNVCSFIQEVHEIVSAQQWAVHSHLGIVAGHLLGQETEKPAGGNPWEQEHSKKLWDFPQIPETSQQGLDETSVMSGSRWSLLFGWWWLSLFALHGTAGHSMTCQEISLVMDKVNFSQMPQHPEPHPQKTFVSLSPMH